MQYSFTDKAEKDLEGIIDFTVYRWGRVQADAYITRLQQTLANVSAFPKTAKHRPELGNGIYSFPFQRHLMYFVISENYLTVLRVLHSSMDPHHHTDT